MSNRLTVRTTMAMALTMLALLALIPTISTAAASSHSKAATQRRAALPPDIPMLTPTPTPTSGPPPPYNLQVINTTQTSIALGWQYYMTYGTFLIWRWDGTQYVEVGGTHYTSYNDQGLTCNTSYSYYVTALDGQGHQSPPSNTAIGATQPCVTPTAIPSDTPTVVSSATETPATTETPTSTSTPSNTPVFTATSTSTATPVVTPTGSPILPTDTATDTPMPTSTAIPAETATATDCPNVFVDLNGNVFYAAIHYLACGGVVNGVDATHYGPAGLSTRGQFAKVAVLGFNLPPYTPSGTPDFSDVPVTYFAYSYIETGFHAGILSGYDQNSCTTHGATFPCYLPNLAITRGQLTKLVVNAGRYALFTPTGGQPTFSDVPPSNVFFASIETAHHNSIINGYPDGTFRPNNNIRRDEMAQVVFAAVTHIPLALTG